VNISRSRGPARGRARIGSGIVHSPAGIADNLPGLLPMLSVWVVGGIIGAVPAGRLADMAMLGGYR
jgi:hypothetical protein